MWLCQLSPSATGLSLLLHVCGKYGLEHDIIFNSKKSAVIIFRNSFVKDVKVTIFSLLLFFIVHIITVVKYNVSSIKKLYVHSIQ